MSKTKLLKAIQNFNNACKEVERLKIKIENSVEDENTEESVCRVLKTKVNQYEQKVESLFAELDPDSSDEKLDMYMDIQDVLLNCTILLEKATQKTKIENQADSLNKVVKISQNLPKLDLPHFYGEIENWISFRELFKSTVLQNAELSDLDKLQYLFACIKGNAAKLIRGFAIQAENLSNCWDTLCERFDNKNLIANCQINKLFSMKIVKANSPKQLYEILDTCNECIRNLSVVGLETNQLTELIIINHCVAKLHEDIIQRWELTLKNDSFPTLKALRMFIEREAQSLKPAQATKNKNPSAGAEKKFIPRSVPYYEKENRRAQNEIKAGMSHSLTADKLEAVFGCFLCREDSNHPLYKCPVFNRMKVGERLKAIKGICCENCLRRNHETKNCKIIMGCKACKLRHHTLLHIYEANQPVNEENVVAVSRGIQIQPNMENSSVLLSTALVKVKSNSGKLLECRALIDNGSQLSLISKELSDKLQLPFQNRNHRIIGINGVSAETSLHSCQIEISPHFSSTLFNLEVMVVNKVTAPLPNFDVRVKHWPHLEKLLLADPEFYIPKKIDLLLGADMYGILLDGIPINGPPGTPTAVPTKLGHLLSGKILNAEPKESIVATSTLDDELRRFWTIEDVPDESLKKDQNQAEVFYQQSVKRNQEGRYTVSLPFKEDKSLGKSKTRAIQLFLAQENKLNRSPPLKEKFNQFMTEYVSLGHMKLITPERENETPDCYIPYHMIQNENSETTKFRVVFNASAKTSNGKSLNDVLDIGPKLQTEIFTHLIRFRSYRVAFAADIEKMYRQIQVAEEDCKYQRIVWRAAPSAPLLTYELQTVTYGTSCAPFLALRTLKQLCMDEKENFPLAIAVAENHFYVDDLLAGANSEDEAKEVIEEIQAFMKSGGFNLRKWSSNHKSILEKMDESLVATHGKHSLGDEEFQQRVLGIFWDLPTDSIQIQVVYKEAVKTKRQLLSEIARTFDPLGLFSPSIIILKILMQDLWKLKADWDDPLPQSILEAWSKFQQESHHFKSISIPRYLGTHKTSTIQVHGFCDASSKAYAAVVYLKTEEEVSLVCAKTRVAPVKQTTIPRLELCGALLLAELISSIQKSLPYEIQELFLWTDSTIVLSWINNPPTKGNVFVQNRVTKILTLSSTDEWHHIPGKQNPADCATRGLYPEQLRNASNWWTGPEWLKHDYPSAVTPVEVLNIQVEKSDDDLQPSTDGKNTNPLDSILNKFSSYAKLIRVFAYVNRFVRNCKSKEKSKGPLQVEELESAIKIIIKTIQASEFASELKCLKSSKPILKSSKLLSLNAFLDENGLLRVGGRLAKHPTLPHDQKFPYIVPKKHHITSLIIRHFHLESLHSGSDSVLSLIRQKYWIPDGRSTVRREIQRCVTCVRFNSKPSNPKMGDLPIGRITQSRPFERVGVDFAGPFLTKCQHVRKSTKFKSYLCLFICTVTRAVHLELVSSLSTEAFLAALRRFIARRGVPAEIWSDNGTNFVGAATYLKKLFKLLKETGVQEFLNRRQITMKFIPPYAPNFGGLWESSVKLAKRHLLKTCKGTLLTFEELMTVLCQIEACINSRPLMPLSTDPSDVRALTPGHFLIGEPLLELPEGLGKSNQSVSLSSRWKSLLQMKEHFWTRWTRSVLHELQSRPKWKRNTTSPLQVGDLVIVLDDHLPPLAWPLARILELVPGADGIHRVAVLQMTSGTTKRAINRLIPLLVPIPRAPEYGDSS